ncbi:hypothetical protein CEXT_490271 [Caerostris extrusa]|uniref:Uncharacterized protein n=1 Tax=Caerostris extrusa TaxID=172846 RepID=A0AAV4V5C3_CAEEX|nr:hypothetical protein CEXT_490271 [Caerostris extrusa]
MTGVRRDHPQDLLGEMDDLSLKSTLRGLLTRWCHFCFYCCPAKWTVKRLTAEVLDLPSGLKGAKLSQ